MSQAYTYDTLKSAMVTWVENNEPDFAAQLDSFIGLAELKLLRDLDLNIFDVEDSISFDNTGLATKPAGYISSRSLFYTASGDMIYLEPRTDEYIRAYGGTGNPLYFCEYSETQLMAAPVPAVSQAVTCRFMKRPAQLSDAQTTTWLSTYVGDALFLGCLLQCEKFVKDRERVLEWQDDYKDVVAGAKKEAYRLGRFEFVE